MESIKRSTLWNLDVVFVVDATGSMRDDIKAVRDNLHYIVESLKKRKEELSVRFGMVAYRDHPPEDKTYVTKSYPLTDNLDAVYRFIDSLEIGGGGDPPEAVVDGLWAAYNFNWRPNAYKVIILIGDAPPHGYAKFSLPIPNVRDKWPNGCPAGLDIFQVVRTFRTRSDILFFVIGCNTYVQHSFSKLAKEGGGQYFYIFRTVELPNKILGSLSHVLSLVDFDSRVLAYYQRHDGVFTLEQCALDLNANVRDVKVALSRLLELGQIPHWPKSIPLEKKIYDVAIEPVEPSTIKGTIELALSNLPNVAPADDLLEFNVELVNKTDEKRFIVDVWAEVNEKKQPILSKRITVLPDEKETLSISWKTPNLNGQNITIFVSVSLGATRINQLTRTVLLY